MKHAAGINSCRNVTEYRERLCLDGKYATRTDANGQSTRLSYDALGRETGETLPGESGSGVPAVLADASGRGLPAAWS